jgi:hypothetical protein
MEIVIHFCVSRGDRAAERFYGPEPDGSYVLRIML